jgi:hypothetical protein
MGGGLMQLVAYGAQDIYLTGNPQITFFKVVYRRHTNFSMETIEQTINGSQTESATGTVTISRNGDLVYKVYVTCANMTAGDNGTALIDNVELEIGGQRIDKQTTQWNQIWSDLTIPESKVDGFKCMTGACGNANTNVVGEVQVPLNFWFCRNPGLALPLIALQYHEVKLKCAWGAAAGTRKVVCDYIYLDTDERRRFAQVSHEYLIEQIQEQSADDSGSFKLNFNHPVKELIWTSAASNSYDTAQLKLNGHDRFASQQEEYFQLRQPMDYHTAVPGQNIVLTDRPQFINPITLPVLTHHNTVTTTACSIGSEATPAGPETVITFKAATVNIPIVGDVLSIALGSEHTADSAGFVDHPTLQVVTSVSTATDPIVTISPGILATAIPAGFTEADGLAIMIVARAQDPLSRTGSLTTKINVYSFGLKPEEHQPSGTCNFSRIDTAKLDIGTAGGMDTSDIIYAVNYNVLRIMSGMGGLAYSN